MEMDPYYVDWEWINEFKWPYPTTELYILEFNEFSGQFKIFFHDQREFSETGPCENNSFFLEQEKWHFLHQKLNSISDGEHSGKGHLSK